MTKRELIEALEDLECADSVEVCLYKLETGDSSLISVDFQKANSYFDDLIYLRNI